MGNICNAYITGNQIGSSTVHFSPGKLNIQEAYEIKCNTAGSVHLILQMILPTLMFCPIPMRITIQGGTDTMASPTTICVEHVLFPLLKKMGLDFQYTIIKRGFFPFGEGRIAVQTKPFTELKPLVLEQRGKITKISIYSVSTIEDHINFHKKLVQKVKTLYGDLLKTEVMDYSDKAHQKGRKAKYRATYIVVESENGSLQKIETFWEGKGEYKGGVEAERVIKELAEIVVNEDVTLDEHHSDQVLIFMALAKGVSVIRVKEMSLHFQTMCYLLPIFLKDMKIDFKKVTEKAQPYFEIKIAGVGYKFTE